MRDDYLSSSNLAIKVVQLPFEFPFYGHYVTNATLTTGGTIFKGLNLFVKNISFTTSRCHLVDLLFIIIIITRETDAGFVSMTTNLKTLFPAPLPLCNEAKVDVLERVHRLS